MEPMLKAAAPQAAAPADLIKDSDQTKFAKDVLETSRTVPVIVDFWAPWCGPCKTLQPAIEKVVKEAKGKVKLVKINIDQNQMLAQQLRIQSIPAVYAFFGGRPVDGFMGAVPESQVKQFVDRLVQAAGGAAGDGAAGDELAAALEHAKQAVADGDIGLATQIYNEVIEVDPENLVAIAGLAKCHMQAGHVDQAKALLAKLPAKDKSNAEIVAIQASIDLAEQAKAAGPVGDLKAKAAADPKNFQARLDLALAYWAATQRKEAIDELLGMIRLDRNWNEGAARQQLLKFFEALGFTDPLAVEGRKRLSSILFS
jgi:putative thioredoxin